LRIPPKRVARKRISFTFRIVQVLRIAIRRKSLVLWKETGDAVTFDRRMKTDLRMLRLATRIYHFTDRLARSFKRTRERRG
jgi:hypothetical protein